MSEFTKISRYTGEVPNYSIATAMELYLTDENTIIPLFLEAKEEFLSDDDVYHTVEKHEVNRIDLVSFKYYGTVNYWWVILLANSVHDPFEISLGHILRIPSPSIIFTKWLR